VMLIARWGLTPMPGRDSAPRQAPRSLWRRTGGGRETGWGAADCCGRRAVAADLHSTTNPFEIGGLVELCTSRVHNSTRLVETAGPVALCMEVACGLTLGCLWPSISLSMGPGTKRSPQTAASRRRSRRAARSLAPVGVSMAGMVPDQVSLGNARPPKSSTKPGDQATAIVKVDHRDRRNPLTLGELITVLRRCILVRSVRSRLRLLGADHQGLGSARRIGAIVRTGSVVRKSTMIVLQSVGFSTRRPCEVPGMIASSPSGRPRYSAIACSRVTSSSSPIITRVRLLTLFKSDTVRVGSCAYIRSSLATTTGKWPAPSGDTSP
jgi:hypothetical protein